VGLQRLVREADGFSLLRSDGSVLRAAAALNATGRIPNTAGLGLAEAGVALDARGAIAVDADSRTSAPGIWAIGDVTQRMNLTPVAIAEGRAFADTEFGRRPSRVDHRTVASAVFTDPPIATVGLTEADAQAAGAGGCLPVGLPADEDGVCRRHRTQLHEAGGRRPERPRAGRAHDRHRRTRDRAEPGGGADLRRHQARLRPHGGGAPHGGRRVRADARAVACTSSVVE
jgi:hypothetical protein